MTRQFSLSVFFLVFLVTYSPDTTQPISAASGTSISAVQRCLNTGAPQSQNSSQDKPYPDEGLKATHHKVQLLKIEELGKIHRFHKERVRKLKKHRNKFWTAAKFVIVCCHLALLIHAFMHLSH